MNHHEVSSELSGNTCIVIYPGWYTLLQVANLAPNLFDEILLIKYSIYFFSYAMVLDTWFTHVAYV